ncbi:MAG TPA: 2,4-dienoyl-CoA reductase [Gammaproteobacteria bacterium]|nr:2,4-dienoyl-CoA reductase [Gammaproteobacteria bacterium]HCO61546.1 2,4-dienoyl-CoA reductase [Porticoccaceae bacterium]
MVNTIYKEDLFAGKVALVTGGGSGIGRRTARELAQLGARVVIAGRNEDKLQESVRIISEEGGTASYVICDIRDVEAVERAVAEAVQQAGTIDLLVNNAGGQFPKKAEEISPNGWRAVIDNNLNGTFFMTQAVFNQVFKEKGGIIVNIIAEIGRGFPIMCHTGAARAGVENMTKTLATEWGRYGVRINAVAPGTIRSSGLDTYDPAFRERALASGKTKAVYRLGTEAEISAAILYLLSPAAGFVTGETLKVDGGDPLYEPRMPPADSGGKHPAFDDD